MTRSYAFSLTGERYTNKARAERIAATMNRMDTRCKGGRMRFEVWTRGKQDHRIVAVAGKWADPVRGIEAE